MVQFYLRGCAESFWHILGCTRTFSSIQSTLHSSTDPFRCLRRVSAHKIPKCRRGNKIWSRVHISTLVMSITWNKELHIQYYSLILHSPVYRYTLRLVICTFTHCFELFFVLISHRLVLGAYNVPPKGIFSTSEIAMAIHGILSPGSTLVHAVIHLQ